MGNRLRIAINAQINPSSGAGGIETVVRALTALTHLDDGAEEYVYIGPWDEPDWLQPLLGSRQRIVRGPQPLQYQPGRLEPLKRALGPLRPAARDVKRFLFRSASSETNIGVPISDGFYESLNCAVIHFPFQFFVRCALPMIYNPHDLQHIHHPEFFEPAVFKWREITYRSACHAAHTVVVASQFVKRDVAQQYEVEPDKIQEIPWAPPPPPLKTSPDFADSLLVSVREKYRLPNRPFALYPAMTWEHKNHIRLLEALALLRDRDALKVHLICTGAQKSFWPRIEQRLWQLGLEEQVKFLGLVAPEELQAIYRAAQFVIIPTLFEAASAPLFEAWQHGVPVACSSITSLPGQAADAALMFDPLSVEDIADAAARLTTDSNLRQDLRRRGARRLQDFSLERTARAYRAVYRRAAGCILSEEDRWLLSRAWLCGPQRKAVAQCQREEHQPAQGETKEPKKIMKRYGLEILPILAAALVLSGCGGAGEKVNSNSAEATAPANVNAAAPVGTANVAPANNTALAPTPLLTPLPAGGGNTPQPGTSPGSGTRSSTNSAPPTQMPTAKIGSGGNDFYLFTQARAAINADAELKGANVILDVKEGVATLSGTVANAEQKSKAERLLRDVGLKTVRNQLRVSVGN